MHFSDFFKPVLLFLLSVALFGLLSVAVAAEEAPRLTFGEPYRGIAILSSAIGDEVSVREVSAFIDECGIDFVVIDFAWITYHWERSNLRLLEMLSRNLQASGVVVAAMYRPRTLNSSEADVHFAQNTDGSFSQKYLCFAYEDSITWGMGWGEEILESCPSIRHLILYNNIALCYCDRCGGDEGQRHAAIFVARCRERWRESHPDVLVGHVGMGLEYAESLDFFCPFYILNRDDPTEAVNTDQLVSEARTLSYAAWGKPIVPLVKVCWADATQNTTEDICNAIESCEDAKMGFLLWYYTWIFHSEDNYTDVRYNPAVVAEALGGDWEAILSEAGE